MSDYEPEDRDRWSELADLAQAGERYATPLPVEQVRRLGDRRRTRRRAGALVAAVAVVAVAGGTLLSQGTFRTDQTPEPAVSPTVVTASPLPTPSRTVTVDNLIPAADVPTVGRERYAATIEAGDREGDRLSVCTPRDGGLSSLGSTAEVDQNFVLTRRSDGSKNPAQEPFNGGPTVFTRALQFESEAAADAAYTTIRGWLKRCPSIMEYEPIGKGIGWIPVRPGAGVEAGFTEFSWRLADEESGEGYFESVGVARMGDRIALTVSVVYGQDYNVSLDPAGDPTTELPPHPQFSLVKAAAVRLRQ